jgi:hypothetical protein
LQKSLQQKNNACFVHDSDENGWFLLFEPIPLDSIIWRLKIGFREPNIAVLMGK